MDKAIQEAVKALTPLAHKLGEGAEALYQIYVKQQIINGVSYLIWTVICALVAVIGYKVGHMFWKKSRDMKKESAYSDYEVPQGIALTSWIVAVVCLLVIPFSLTAGIQHIINPQYYAIKDITCQVANKGCDD